MSLNYIACFSVPMLLFSSTLLADYALNASPYDHCFQPPYFRHDSPVLDEAAIGECFYLAADNIWLGNQDEPHGTLARSHRVSALQYADSWFRLALHKGDSVALSFLHHTERYLQEAQVIPARQPRASPAISEDTHVTRD